MKLPYFNLIFLKKLFAKKVQAKGEMYNAKHDWKSILFSFVVLSLILAGFSGYLFFKINNGELFKVEQESDSPAEIVNKKNLDDVVDRFEAKKAKLIELEQKNNIMPDPSI